ncbi:MAG: RAD55 family ATPase, partial [Candidatus Thermoplasmatota archaeon]
MRRIKTYVEGFDEILNGGIPHGSVVLIAGTTGTMKSSFAYSILYNNARHGIKALYLALQHSEKNLLAQMENFGMPYEKVAGSLYILDRYKLQEGIEKYFKKTFFDTLLEHLLLLKQDF